MDGPNKSTTDINDNTICLVKKKGKVKALDEELYSESIHISQYIFMIDFGVFFVHQLWRDVGFNVC